MGDKESYAFILLCITLYLGYKSGNVKLESRTFVAAITMFVMIFVAPILAIVILVCTSVLALFAMNRNSAEKPKQIFESGKGSYGGGGTR